MLSGPLRPVVLASLRCVGVCVCVRVYVQVPIPMWGDAKDGQSSIYVASQLTHLPFIGRCNRPQL